MRLTIDNMDGAGAREYTSALAAESPLRIERLLREPARCTGALHVSAFGLPVPVRGAHVVLASDAGAELFSGYVVSDAAREFAGVAAAGAVHRVVFSAISNAVDAPALGAGTAHVLKDGDGVLQVAALANGRIRELARDVTVSGEIEPTTYVTEYFMGDGATSTFQLTQAPFHAANATMLDERFDGAAIDPQRWIVQDAGGSLGLTSRGLTMNGGNGVDGQTVLSAIEPIEIGGTLVIEADGVAFDAGSDGVVCGLYSGAVERASCLAGFNVRQSEGATMVTPLVNGVEMGTSLTMLSGHRYILRLRVHCPEVVRTSRTYTALVEGELRSFGGGGVDAPVALVFEYRDAGLASNAPATVLYAGGLANSPATCTFGAVDCIQMSGAIERCGITQAGSAWIVTTATDGTETVRVTGAAGDGVDCMLSPSGRITFFQRAHTGCERTNNCDVSRAAPRYCAAGAGRLPARDSAMAGQGDATCSANDGRVRERRAGAGGPCDGAIGSGFGNVHGGESSRGRRSGGCALDHFGGRHAEGSRSRGDDRGRPLDAGGTAISHRVCE